MLLVFFVLLKTGNMVRSINSGVLTKATLLNKISQVSIYSEYLGLPVEVIKDCIDNGTLIKSPLRMDTNPTCGFRYNNRDMLKFKDFAGYFWGDCFDVVGYILSDMYNRKFNVNSKDDFNYILRHIAYTFKDIFYGSKKDYNLKQSLSNTINTIRSKKSIIEVATRKWNVDDINYWASVGVDIKTLNKEFIYPVDQYYLNRGVNPEPKYYYNHKDPCYCYFLGKDRNNIDSIKLYFPKRTKRNVKFLANYNHLEGILSLNDTYDMIILTKSTKDRLALKCFIKDNFDFNIGVINIPHETYRLSENEYSFLNSKLKIFDSVVSLMDNDNTGIEQAKHLKDKYDIDSYIIPIKYECKDFAEIKSNKFKDEIYNNFKVKINEYNKQYEANGDSPF